MSEDHVNTLAAGRTIPCEPNTPWNTALAGLTADSEWWDLELKEPALLLLSRILEVGHMITGDAPIIGVTPTQFAASSQIEARSQQQTDLSNTARGGPTPLRAITDGGSHGSPFV